MRKISKKKIQLQQAKILTWYTKNGRDLPWRKTRDPYKILVSEVMLQQTQVSRVVPKYLQFIKKYPTLKALAQARRSSLLTLWSGLGYNSRVLRLQSLAKKVVAEHEGRLPAEEEALRALPGIGPYTMRAVHIFAWNKDTVCIDTNIRRILMHELGLDHKISLQALNTIAETCLPKGRSRAWHNALMDYGALVLTCRRTGIKAAASQKPFRASKRYFRGQIMKSLVERKQVKAEELIARYQTETAHDIELIIDDLVREGLLRRRATVLHI